MARQTIRLRRRTLLQGGLLAATGLAATGLAAPAVHAQTRSLSLFLLGPDQKGLAWLNEALAEFKDQTGYDVEIRQSDWGSAFQKLLTAAASGTMSDVSMMGQVMTPSLSSKGAFLPIDDYLADWDQTEMFFPEMLADGTYNGKSYAIPVYGDTRTTLYRADLLEQVGVSTDSLPKTWDELKAVAQKLSSANGGPLDAPFFSNQNKSVGLMQTYSIMLYQAGGEFFGPDGKSNLSSESGKNALEYLVSYFAEGLANPNITYQGSGSAPLVQGTAGIMYGGTFEVQNARSNNPEVVESIYAGLPLAAEAGGEPVTIAWLDKLGIGANTKDPEGSWKLLSFLTSKESATKIAEFWGGLPTRKDAMDAPYLADVKQGYIDATKYAKKLPDAPNLLQIQQEINIAMQAAVRQVDTPANILAGLDQKIDTINGV